MAMSDENWEEQFRQFLRKTGDDFRRAGEDIRTEAQKLLDAAMDPEKQQKVRDRLNELTMWARKTAQGVAGAVEEAATKAETMFHRATDSVTEGAPAAAGATGAAHKAAPAAKKASKAKAKSGKSAKKGGGKRKR
jgi:thioesterase domain-containing protein